MIAVYVSMVDSHYSRSGVYFAKDPGSKVFKKFPTSKFRQIGDVLKLRGQYNPREAVIIVMSPNHALVALFKIFTKFEVTLDAGWPLSDSSSISDGFRKKVSQFRNLIIDYASFQLADKVILESQTQKNSVSSKFRIDKAKIHVLFTGLHEEEIERFRSFPVQPDELNYLKAGRVKYVFFRGKYNLESGLPTIIETARLMAPGTQFIIVTDKNIVGLPSNVTIIKRHVSTSELIWLYQNASCVLGQISNHKRLSKTLPHKLFESAYFSKCYISPANSGVCEFLNDSAFIPVNPVNAKGLKESIEFTFSNVSLQQNYEKAINDCYTNFAKQENLSLEFRQIIESGSKHFS